MNHVIYFPASDPEINIVGEFTYDPALATASDVSLVLDILTKNTNGCNRPSNFPFFMCIDISCSACPLGHVGNVLCDANNFSHLCHSWLGLIPEHLRPSLSTLMEILL